MKISQKQYAQALYELVNGKSEQEIISVIEKFVKVLINNNDTGKINKIVSSFSDIWNEKNGIVEAEIVSARKLDDQIVKLLNGYIVRLLDVNEVVLRPQIDADILGGVVVRYNDKLLDNSLKTRINKMKSILEF